MERACHERIVVRCIAEHHQLCTAQGIIVLGCLSCLLYNPSHQLHRIHVKSCLGGTHINGTADALGLRQRLGDGEDQVLIRSSHPLADKGGITADKIHAHFLCSLVQRLCNGHEILR